MPASSAQSKCLLLRVHLRPTNCNQLGKAAIFVENAHNGVVLGRSGLYYSIEDKTLYIRYCWSRARSFLIDCNETTSENSAAKKGPYGYTSIKLVISFDGILLD